MLLDFTKEAYKNFSNFNKFEQNKISEKFDYLLQNYETLKNSKNITALVGFKNKYRYKISKDIRAIFTNTITILILKIGYRKDIYGL